MKQHKILFLEDEVALAEIVKETLELRGFEVLQASNITQAFAMYKSGQPDVLILDVMLPDGDGFSLLKKIRHIDNTTPALFLTAKSLPADVVTGFEVGANDYLKKPFSVEELIIRIKSLLGMVNVSVSPALDAKGPIAIGAYLFHYPDGILVHNGIQKKLTYREAEILYTLVAYQNKMVTRHDLLMKYWNNDDYFSGRSLDVFITKLRKYLLNDSSIAIMNFRGKGYKLIF